MSGPGQAAGIPMRGGVSLGARFVLLAAVALVLMIVDHRQDHLRRVRELLSLAVYPITVAVDMPFSAWETITESLTDRRALRRENERLKDQLLYLQFQLQKLQSLESENASLRELFDTYGGERDHDVRIAEILSVDLENRQRFIINRGLADGVYVGQPLLDADGVVGQIRSVSRMTSEAMLITDADHAVHVTVGRNGLRTIAEGTGDTGALRLPYVTNSDDIRRGDELFTSGLGGVFPRGRPVAKVTDVRRQPGQPFAEVIATPVAALDRDQEVLLVWNNEQPAADAPAASLTEPRP
jgi:rod shape-determining protein MreC